MLFPGAQKASPVSHVGCTPRTKPPPFVRMGFRLRRDSLYDVSRLGTSIGTSAPQPRWPSGESSVRKARQRSSPSKAFSTRSSIVRSPSASVLALEAERLLCTQAKLREERARGAQSFQIPLLDLFPAEGNRHRRGGLCAGTFPLRLCGSQRQSLPLTPTILLLISGRGIRMQYPWEIGAS